MSEVGKAIARIRKEIGITQQELSERTGLSRSHIAEIEAGRYSPTLKTLELIAEACNKKLKDFV